MAVALAGAVRASDADLPAWGWLLYAVIVGLLTAALIALWIEAWKDRK